VAEAELLAPLGELLMPGVPVTEMFRSFKSPAGWGGNYLEPDLTAYGLLKDEDAALFVEYDGYYRHATKEGTEKDLLKNKALLDFAPVGSFVVRIRHKGKSQLKEHALWVGVKTWGRGDQTSLARVLTEVLEDTVPRLRHALHPCVCKRLEAHVLDKKPIIISRSAQDFRETAVAASKGNTAEEIYNFLGAEGFENADIERLPEQALVGGVSIERSLQPLLLWLLDLGLAKSQVAKALKIKPNLLAYSVELNLKPKRQWFLDLGLTKSQVAKAVAAHPGILGYSLEQNLKPTVQWFVDLGLTKSQVAKTVVALPQILGCSVEKNLKPTVQWLADLGLSKNEVTKMAANFPQILSLSVEKNLASKVKLLHTFLPARDVLGLIARWPCILGYRRQRLEDRLNILAEQDSLAKLISAMPLTDEAFHKRFVIRERKKHYGCSLSYRKAVKIFEKENYQFATSREARAIPPTASHFLLGVVFLLRGSTCTLSCRF
jgi:mTERF domain-containing protein